MPNAATTCALLVESTGAVDLALSVGTLSHRWHGVPVTPPTRSGCSRPAIRSSTPRSAVPIDLDLGELRTLVISGPNTGGKTVALKTLGLAAILHQCGLWPPAERAALPVFDDVLADIGDRQSIEMNLSTFSGHVRSIVEILDAAGPRSLVLLDELAGGTDPDEGAALAQALVARFAGQARLTVVTTHYAALKEWASSAPGAANAATGLDLETDEPLYSLVLGRAGISHALRTAERLGLDARRRRRRPGSDRPGATAHGGAAGRGGGSRTPRRGAARRARPLTPGGDGPRRPSSSASSSRCGPRGSGHAPKRRRRRNRSSRRPEPSSTGSARTSVRRAVTRASAGR